MTFAKYEPKPIELKRCAECDRLVWVIDSAGNCVTCSRNKTPEQIAIKDRK